MPEAPAITVAPVVPCNDLDAAERWWDRLGFRCLPHQNYGDYRILVDSDGAQVHLTLAVDGWVIPGRNPFGVYIYTPRVAAIAQAVPDAIIGDDKTPEHKPWGMMEIALNGPDDLLVRIGWASSATEPQAT
jgi:hypothetical protein